MKLKDDVARYLDTSMNANDNRLLDIMPLDVSVYDYLLCQELNVRRKTYSDSFDYANAYREISALTYNIMYQLSWIMLENVMDKSNASNQSKNNKNIDELLNAFGNIFFSSKLAVQSMNQIELALFSCWLSSLLLSNVDIHQYLQSMQWIDNVIAGLLLILSQRSSDTKCLCIAISCLLHVIEKHELFNSINSESNMIQLLQLLMSKSIYPTHTQESHINSAWEIGICRVGIKKLLSIVSNKSTSLKPAISNTVRSFVSKWCERIKGACEGTYDGLRVPDDIPENRTSNATNITSKTTIIIPTIRNAIEVLSDIITSYEDGEFMDYILKECVLPGGFIDILSVYIGTKTTDPRTVVSASILASACISLVDKRGSFTDSIVSEVTKLVDVIDHSIKYYSNHTASSSSSSRKGNNNNPGNSHRQPLQDLTNATTEACGKSGVKTASIKATYIRNDDTNKIVFEPIVKVLIELKSTCISSIASTLPSDSFCNDMHSQSITHSVSINNIDMIASDSHDMVIDDDDDDPTDSSSIDDAHTVSAATNNYTTTATADRLLSDVTGTAQPMQRLFQSDTNIDDLKLKLTICENKYNQMMLEHGGMQQELIDKCNQITLLEHKLQEEGIKRLSQELSVKDAWDKLAKLSSVVEATQSDNAFMKVRYADIQKELMSKEREIVTHKEHNIELNTTCQHYQLLIDRHNHITADYNSKIDSYKADMQKLHEQHVSLHNAYSIQTEKYKDQSRVLQQVTDKYECESIKCSDLKGKLDQHLELISMINRLSSSSSEKESTMITEKARRLSIEHVSSSQLL